MHKRNIFSMECKNIGWMGVRVDKTNKFIMKLHTARCFHLTPVHAVLFTQHKISLHCLTSFMEKISSFNERESKHFTSVSLSHSSKLVLIQRATNQTHSKNSQILTYSVPECSKSWGCQ